MQIIFFWPVVRSYIYKARAFRKLLSIYVFSYFPLGSEGRIWDLIVSVPNHCLSFYFASFKLQFDRNHVAVSFQFLCSVAIKVFLTRMKTPPP